MPGFLALVLATSACGGTTTSQQAEGSDAGLAEGIPDVIAIPDIAVSDGPPFEILDGTGPDTTGRNPDCPTTIPTDGSPCKPVLGCDYGDDPHHICLTHVACVAKSLNAPFNWSVLSPPANCGSNEATCPASFTALARGAPCPGVTSKCTYPEGQCGCVTCTADGAMSKMWACREWGPTEAGCPAVPPRTGDACTTTDLECSYGGFCRFSVSPTMVCDSGYWRVGGPLGSCILPVCGAP
jgi:hypothetical protein